eukprot:TRINITY_DN202_c0_g1_i4.p1 TRINITY_DN202_c0_g1~~TRINITY_DN202_c0_g1_i4.p1  ORF type:complete len:219 (-),score=-46.64 TRINITY_DN202_c0_g1_i4:170-826(-)
MPFTTAGLPSPEVTVEYCRVPQDGFSQAPWNLLPAHLSRFAVRTPQRLTPPKLFLEAWDHSVRGCKAPSSSPLGVMPCRLSLAGPSRAPYGFEPRPCGQANMGMSYPSPSLLWKPSVMVQEYQPACHQLRLSASPQGPTNPGEINFTQEPLGLRRTSFSLVLSLLKPALSLPSAPPVLTVRLHSPWNARLPLSDPEGSLNPWLRYHALAPLHFWRRFA